MALVVALFMAAIFAAYNWLGSDAGRGWLVKTLSHESHGNIEIQGLSGQPLAAWKADRIFIHNSELSMQIENPSIKLSLWQLFSRQLSISSITASRIELQQHRSTPTPSSTASAPPLSLPLAIEIIAITVKQIDIISPDHATTSIHNTQLAQLHLGKNIAGQLHSTLPQGALSLQLSGTLTQWQLVATLIRSKKERLTLKLSGQQLQQGKAALNISYATLTSQLQGAWTRDKTGLKAKGGLQLHHPNGSYSGPWSIATPVDFSTATWHLEGIASSKKRLLRNIPLQLQGRWTPHNTTASVREQDKSIALQLHYADEQLLATLNLTDWHAPFKQAEGVLTGQFKAQWSAQNRQWQSKGSLSKGELAGLTARIKLESHGHDQQWQLDRGELQALGMHLQLTGSGTEKRLDLSGTLTSADIAPALLLAGIDHSSGELNAAIHLHGDTHAPQVDLNAQLTKLQLNSISVGTAHFDGHYDAKQDSLYHFTAAQISQHGESMIKKLQLKGAIKKNIAELHWQSSGSIESQFTLTGNISNPTDSTYLLTDSRLRFKQRDILRAERVPLRIHGRDLSISPSKISLLGAASHIELAITEKQLHSELIIHAVTLKSDDPIQQKLPLHLTGQADISLLLAGKPNAPIAQLKISSPTIQIQQPMFADDLNKQLPLHDLLLQASYQQSQLRWQINGATPGGGLIQSHGHSPLQWSLQPWRLSMPSQAHGEGELTINLPKLSALQPLLPALTAMQGSSQLQATWPMPPSFKTMKGNAQVEIARFGIAEFGVNIHGSVRSSLKEGIPYAELQLISGAGDLKMKGPIHIADQTLPDIHLNHFTMIDLPSQQMEVTGAIAVTKQQQLGVIQGQLTINRMKLEIPTSQPSPTPDLQWPNDDTPSPQQLALSALNIDLTLSDVCEIYGHGMRLKPQGTLHLGGSITQPKVVGTLAISSGKIEFRSIKLNIMKESRVQFTGNPKRPTIYIKAAREIGNIVAGVIVSGPTDQLSTKLFSEPAMSNAEIFSWIATGRPLSSLGQDSASDLMTAAAFILGPGTMMQEVQNRVKRASGLDLFEVGGDQNGATIKAGRKLSDKIMLTVDQAIAREPSTTLTLEYTLKKSLSIFASQTVNMPPKLGLRYSKTWFGSDPTGK
ncbi:MAG: translocation/assembly module TamB domain-containing protein [Mariprofundus sp.]|nr:translocation/assembly module TamB domain-containing protein [Mariprofundus sp.]